MTSSLPSSLFLQEKIMELEQALFFDLSESLLKFPTSVINVLHVDELGQVWFVVKRPTQSLSEFDGDFNARLEFYRKGKNFHLHVEGKAFMITDPEVLATVKDLSPQLMNNLNDDMVLIKLTIDQLFYYPHKEKAQRVLPEFSKVQLYPSAFIKSLQYIVKDIIPVFQSH